MDLSILIPVYNGEKYIKTSLENIFLEISSIKSNISYEVLIYDDGSTDKTFELLKTFKNTPHLKIHQNKENKGLAYSRNYLLQNAIGSYILFIDSDDAFVSGNLSKSLEKYITSGNDLVVFSTIVSYPQTGRTQNWFLTESSITKTAYLQKFLRTEMPFFAWGKLIKKELFDNITYPEGEIFEDTLTMLKVALHAQKIQLSETPLIMYKKREESLSEGNELNYFYLIKRAFEIESILKNNQIDIHSIQNELFCFKILILTEGLSHISKLSLKELSALSKGKINIPLSYFSKLSKNKLLSKKKKKAFIHAVKANNNKIKYTIKENSQEELLLFCIIKNEEQRIDYFYEYYMKLGVTHFYIILNNCTDGSKEKLSKYSNTTIFEINKNYNHHWKWITRILTKYGKNHWCLVVDIDELFVYKDMDKYSLKDFINSLEEQNYNGVKSLLVDFYPEKILENNTPFMSTYYFDKDYYDFVHSTEKRFLHKCHWYKGYSGGPRSRVMGLKKVNLTKYPLFYLTPKSHLYQGMHYLHGNNCQEYSSILKHYKFDYFYEARYSDLANNSNFDEIKVENTSYLKFYKDQKNSFYSPEISVKFVDNKQFEEIGFIKSNKLNS